MEIKMVDTKQSLEALLATYDALVSETTVNVDFTREELERQFMVNRLRGKDTVLSACHDNDDKDNWYLSIKSV